MKHSNLKKITRTVALVAGLAFITAMPLSAQNSNLGNTSSTTTSTSTPVRTNNNTTTVQQKTEVRTETQRGLPWGLLGLLGLAGLIPRKREVNQVAVAEFKDTARPKEIHTEVRETTTNTVRDNTSTTDNRNNS